MELPLFISLRRKYGRLFHWSLENYVTTASLNTSSESAKFAICFLEYIDLVNFSLNTFMSCCFLLLLFFVFVLFYGLIHVIIVILLCDESKLNSQVKIF